MFTEDFCLQHKQPILSCDLFSWVSVILLAFDFDYGLSSENHSRKQFWEIVGKQVLWVLNLQGKFAG